jgi:hypothetical protein
VEFGKSRFATPEAICATARTSAMAIRRRRSDHPRCEPTMVSHSTGGAGAGAAAAAIGDTGAADVDDDEEDKSSECTGDGSTIDDETDIVAGAAVGDVGVDASEFAVECNGE